MPLDPLNPGRRPHFCTAFSGNRSLRILLLTLLMLGCRSDASPRLRRSLWSRVEQENTSATTYEPNKDEMSGSSSTRPRVIIKPFQLQLSKTAATLSELELLALLGTMESVVFDYMLNKNTQRRHLQVEGTLKYVKFERDVKQEYNSTMEAVTLTFDAGVASYSANPTPNSTLVNQWVKDSLLLNLITYMHKDNAFASIASVTGSFAVQYPATSNSTDAGTTVAGPTTVADPTTVAADNRSTETGGGSNIPLIAGSAAAAAAACVFLLIGFAATRRKRALQAVEVNDPGHLQQQQNEDRKRSTLLVGNEASAASRGKGEDKNQTPKATSLLLDDGRSVADSESEWTVATEAGDSMALKNIYPNSLLLKTGHQAGHDLIGLVPSESFERDRQVAITKDMLTGQWSGRVSNTRGAGGPHSESVLQPSHFSASQERRVRKAAKAAAAACPDRETSSISSKEESLSNDSLVFEEAHEDAWGKQGQVSPSRTSKRRSRARSPPPIDGSGELL